MRNQRRRLLLAEDPGADSTDSADGSLRLLNAAGDSADAPGRTYGSKARNQCERRVMDFIPLRRLTIVAILTVALLLVAGATTLHVYISSLADVLRPDEVVGLRLDEPRNISHWLASTFLSLAALSATLIYLLRRHRADDYHGRYRVWLWAAIGCLVLSLLETTDMALVVRGICRRAAEFCSLDPAIIWPILATSFWALAGLRVLIEIRRSRLATVALVLGGLALATAIVVEQGWIVEIGAKVRPAAERSAYLTGYAFVLTAFLCYARQVVLDVMGQGAARDARPRRTKTAKAPSGRAVEASQTMPALQLRTDLDPVEKTHSSKPSVATHAAATADKSSAVAAKINMGSSEANHHTSKAERRRMRREARMAG